MIETNEQTWRAIGDFAAEIAAQARRSAALAAFEAADEAWQIELENAFPDAHEARYLPRGKGKEGTPLRAAYDAREAARLAWEATR